MNLKSVSKKFRHIADCIDDLLLEAETPAKADSIRRTLHKKPHWTQRPENKAKLAKSLKKMAAAKAAKN